MPKLLLLFLLSISFYANSQDFKFGQISQAEHDFKREQIDSNANAIYLNEYGTTQFKFDRETGKMSLVYDYHSRIKIFNKEGFDAANIVVPLYKNGSNYEGSEIISNIKASTFNYTGFKYEETAMANNAIFKEERHKYLSLTKFTLPNIKENSIIEIQYTVETPFVFNFKTWDFQDRLPKLNSTYVAFLPANYNYNVTLRGFYKLTDSKAEVSSECLTISGKNIDCSKMTYNMKNIPAFIEEDFMTAAINFKSAIYFELKEVFYVDGTTQKYTKDWKNVDIELANSKDFGGQMKKKDVFKSVLANIIKETDTDLDKAKAIYNYVKKQIRWNNYYGKYAETSVKEVLDKRSGNVADINFALISALSSANLDAEAVILSTRNNGVVHKLHPILSNFDYVIAKVNIGTESFLLDATEPLLPFGVLPLRCVNDQGRVINLKKPSYWIDLTPGTKSSSAYNFIGEMDEKGKIKGKLITYSAGYDALKLRKEIKSYSHIDEFVEKLNERLSKIRITNYNIFNIDSVDNDLKEEYEVEITTNGDLKSINFNPFFINPKSKNPFKLSERNYPVDLGTTTQERANIVLTVPSNYKIKEQPGNLSLALPNKGGRYLFQSSVNENQVVFTQIFNLGKPIYSPDEYYDLKEFYNRIIQLQKNTVQFTKTN